MDYKKIIKSRAMRGKILRLLRFIPDRPMIQLQYRIKMGRKLNLKNPQRFTEKLQWYKLYYRHPDMPRCVDKYDVRRYVEECGLGHILNELYGVYEKVEDIDFDSLPNQFVIKDTLGGGGNGIIVCKNKDDLDWNDACKKMRAWVSQKVVKNGGREWPYYSGHQKHRLIIEKYIDSNENEGGLIDYKFFCFQGKVEFLYVVADRELGVGAGLGVFDARFNMLRCRRADERPLKRNISKPDNYDELIKCAQRLSGRFPHARVDLYSHNHRVIFGEITFFDGSGYMCYEPDSFDYEAGKYFALM